MDDKVVEGWVEVLTGDGDDLFDGKTADASCPGLVTPESAGEVVGGKKGEVHRLSVESKVKSVKRRALRGRALDTSPIA